MNYVPIFHRFFRYGETIWSKIADFNLPTPIWRPQLGEPVGISPRSLASKIEFLRYRMALFA